MNENAEFISYLIHKIINFILKTREKNNKKTENNENTQSMKHLEVINRNS